MAASAIALNMMLDICQKFATMNFVEFSISKTMVPLVTPTGNSIETRPNI